MRTSFKHCRSVLISKKSLVVSFYSHVTMEMRKKAMGWRNLRQWIAILQGLLRRSLSAGLDCEPGNPPAKPWWPGSERIPAIDSDNRGDVVASVRSRRMEQHDQHSSQELLWLDTMREANLPLSATHEPLRLVSLPSWLRIILASVVSFLTQCVMWSSGPYYQQDYEQRFLIRKSLLALIGSRSDWTVWMWWSIKCSFFCWETRNLALNSVNETVTG